MISQGLLSNNQFYYLTSQEKNLSKQFNKSQDLSRLRKTIDECFRTFEIVLESKELPQRYVDGIFASTRIRDFVRKLIEFDETKLLSDETNKQKIARLLLETCFEYYKQRYKPTKFLLSEIKKIELLLHEIDELAKTQADENDAMMMYRLRKKAKSPPALYQRDSFWSAVCMHCYAHDMTTNKTKKDVIYNVQHHKGCTYHQALKDKKGKEKEEVIEQYLKFYPPRKMK